MGTLFGASGCGGGNPATGLAAPAEHVDQRLVTANNEFGLDLFHRLIESGSRVNIFISPASISMALAMTYNGAAGETGKAMEETLRYQDISLADLNKAFADLKTILANPDPKVELAVANSLWARQGVDFYEEFLQRNRDFYGAEVTELDFNDPAVADTINAWVRERTRERIEEIVEAPIDPMAVLFLINAIYFKGEWSLQFDPQLTREIPFTLPDGSREQHPLMSQSGSYRYLEKENFQAACLPYGENKRVGMYIFLPGPHSSLDEFYRELNAANWTDWMDSFTEMEGDIGLPRFKFEYETSLNDALKALGMANAFDPAAADFSGMRPIPPELFINEVKHKTFVEVNEEGTEAAAVTSVEIRVTSLPQTFNLVADRPFFFAIVDNQTGTILFMGSLLDPR